MKYFELNRIKKLYFGYEEISRALGISLSSARVSATRYVKQGFLVRAKRNVYVLRERWKTLTIEEKFVLANLLEVPSYISLMTAMGYHEVTTQVQRDFIESLAVKRTKETDVEGAVFKYTKIKKELYFGFRRDEGFFIASPEKAFLDAVYLVSIKKYSFDISSVDTDKLDMGILRELAEQFPSKTRKYLEGNGYFKKT